MLQLFYSLNNYYPLIYISAFSPSALIHSWSTGSYLGVCWICRILCSNRLLFRMVIFNYKLYHLIISSIMRPGIYVQSFMTNSLYNYNDYCNNYLLLCVWFGEFSILLTCEFLIIISKFSNHYAWQINLSYDNDKLLWPG